MITSKTNNKIKNIKKLLESGKARKEQKLFVVEGERIVSEVPPELLEEIYISETKNRQLSGEPEGRIPSFAGKVEVVSDEVFRSAADTVHPQGILAVVRQPEYELAEMLLSGEGKSTVVLLDDIRDPGNLGTILRTSEAAGADLVILSRGCVDLFNPKVVRSTMGSIFRVPFVTADLPSAAELLKQNGYGVYGTCPEESRSYKEIAYGPKNAFVIGNEANGISREVLEAVTANVTIPMQGKVESLNAAVSLAVLLFHLI